MLMRCFKILCILLIAGTLHAQESIYDLSEESSARLNNAMRKTNRRLLYLEGTLDINSRTSGILTIDRGGTGLDLSTNTQGAIYYDDGTTEFKRLDPGTAGQVLTTKGAAANPEWSTNADSNVIFAWRGIDDYSQDINAGHGIYMGTSTAPALTTCENFYYLGRKSGDISTFRPVIPAWKWKKAANINTLTVSARCWTASASATNLGFKLVVGTASGSGTTTTNETTPTWRTAFTVDVSGLTDGTVYDMRFDMSDAGGATSSLCCSGLVVLSE